MPCTSGVRVSGSRRVCRTRRNIPQAKEHKKCGEEIRSQKLKRQQRAFFFETGRSIGLTGRSLKQFVAKHEAMLAK